MRTRLTHWRFVWWLILAVLLMLSASCNRGGLRDVGHPGPGPREYYPPEGIGLIDGDGLPVNYVPYIEDIEIPEQLYEGQPFQIVIRISADFRPAVLAGYPYWQQHLDDGDGRLDADEFTITALPEELGYSAGWKIYIPVTLYSPPGVGAAIHRFVFEIPGVEAGTYLVTTYSTTERSLGGIGGVYTTPYGYVEGDPEFLDGSGVRPIEFEIEVLPRDSTDIPI